MENAFSVSSNTLRAHARTACTQVYTDTTEVTHRPSLTEQGEVLASENIYVFHMNTHAVFMYTHVSTHMDDMDPF